MNIAIIDNIMSESQMDNLRGSKLRKIVSPGSLHEKESLNDHQLDNNLVARVVSIKHK